ncbi:MAG: hypothetical protein KC416_03350 [Myxococcales bacterium]|nr:hypothetical protein [Myxococcales bacterium]
MRRWIPWSCLLFSLTVRADDGACDLGESDDPLEVARLVQRCGEVAVRRDLDPKASIADRYGALVAVRYLEAPESVLPSLVSYAVGRDPDLAEAAAQSLEAVVTHHAVGALDRGVDAHAEWGELEEALDHGLSDTTIRPDIRTMLRRVRGYL